MFNTGSSFSSISAVLAIKYVVLIQPVVEIINRWSVSIVINKIVGLSQIQHYDAVAYVDIDLGDVLQFFAIVLWFSRDLFVVLSTPT